MIREAQRMDAIYDRTPADEGFAAARADARMADEEHTITYDGKAWHLILNAPALERIVDALEIAYPDARGPLERDLTAAFEARKD